MRAAGRSGHPGGQPGTGHPGRHRHLPGDDFFRQPDQRGQAPELSLLQAGPYTVPRRQPGHHDQAHRLRDVDVRARRMFQLPVGVSQLLGDHPDAPVGDGDEHTALVQQPARDLHRHIGRGERRGVLDQLGQDVDHVTDGRTGHRNIRLRVQRDPFVFFDLGYRCPDHIGQRRRLIPAAGHVVTCQDQQVLRGPVHPRRQAVHPDQPGQPVPVLLPPLEAVEQAHLAFRQRAAAMGQVDEHGVELAAQACLVARQARHLPAHRVEGAGDVAYLITGMLARALAGPLVRGRGPAAGRVEGLGAQPVERAQYRPGRYDGDPDRNQESHDGRDGEPEHRRPAVVRARGGDAGHA